MSKEEIQKKTPWLWSASELCTTLPTSGGSSVGKEEIQKTQKIKKQGNLYNFNNNNNDDNNNNNNNSI
jgi:hypothetical protein